MFLIKQRISIDSCSLNIFSSLLKQIVEIIDRSHVFFEQVWHFRVFKISILIANNTIEFFHFKLFRFYWKYFNIILSFFLYSLRENKLVKSIILF